MEPRHHLRCLGQPALFAPSGEPVRFRTKKHLALLIYLAVERGRAHRRDKLSELLWPRSNIAEARHSLATALSILRPRLGRAALVTTRDQVTLSADRLTLDLDRLLARDILGTETTGILEVAGFLEGFDIPDSTEFSLWKDRQQARLLPMIKDGLVQLIERCRRTGDSRQIENLADRALAFDELSEEGIRAKMEARAMAGDRLTALKLFEEWRTKLWNELRALPSQPLQQMAASLRRGGWERSTIEDIPAVPLTASRERIFIGRGIEYERLYEAWHSMKAGAAIHTLVLGDSGVGKTTLVERLTTAASLEGASIARVQSYDIERSIPFATLAGLVVGLLDKPGASAARAESLAELARAVPEVRRRFPTLPQPDESQGETARIRLTEAFQEFVSAVADEHPVILIVDDLHLADEASLAVLHLMLRRATRQSVMAIFTARPGELRHSYQAALLRESLRTLAGIEVSIGPLDESSSADLLNALFLAEDPKPSASILRSLVAASGGYPMVLELLVQDWRMNGSSSPALALDAMTEEYLGHVGPAAAYAKILMRITGALNPHTTNALNLASVLGHRLNDLSMYSIIDMNLGQTMAALAELAEVRVLREGENGLEFSNELVRAHAYASISSSVRKTLHAAVADRFVHAPQGSPATSGLEIAWHSIRAGRTSEAISYLFRGALHAMRSGAPQSADRALASALPSLQGEDLLKGTILLVESLQEQGRWRESVCALDSLPPDTPTAYRQEAFALASLAKVFLGTPMSEWLELLPDLKEIMLTCPHTPSRIRAAKAVAHATSGLRDPNLARGMLEVVDRIPLSDLDPDTKGQVGLTKALLLFQAGQMDASYELASSHLEELKTRGLANVLVTNLQTGLGSIRGRQGRYAEAAAHHERAVRLANLVGNDTLCAHISSNLAWCYGRLGRYEEQLACAQSSLGASRQEGVRFTEVHLASSIAFALASLGRIAEMRNAIRDCEIRLGPDVAPSITQPWLFWKADALAAAGLRSEALQCAINAILSYEFRLESRALAGAFARWIAVTCRASYHEQKAREILIALADRIDDHDALDQVEILSAIIYCGWSHTWATREELAKRALLVPQSALIPLRTIGLAV